ncbi:MAG: PTS sugar transporter subunit IIA [Gammaproteobacteria bacterium]|nr:PTS sugar transporter subunit IIA [Gammaproteobacteria bacterium]
MTQISTDPFQPDITRSAFNGEIMTEVALDYLHKEFVVMDLGVASRKRLFEELSQLIVANSDAVSERDCIFKTLNDRERLGSTGLGKGIALPHGRLEGIKVPIIAAVKLKEPIAYDAIDGQPVWLAICLLVPVDADETHLKLLSRLATGFSEDGFIEKLKQAKSTDELYEIFLSI